MKKSIRSTIKSIIAVSLCCGFFFVLSDRPVKALEKEELLNSLTPNDIIGETIINDTVYFNYNGGPVSLNRTIVNENTEKISSKQYKIYPGKNFEYIQGNWHHFEYATTTLVDYNERYKDKLGYLDWLIPPAIAQSVYYPSDEQSMYSSGANWNTVHTDTEADTKRGTAATIYYIQAQNAAGTYYIERHFINIDTSGITNCVASSSYNIKANTNSGAGASTYGIFDSNHTDTDDAQSFNDGTTNNLSDTYFTRSQFIANTWLSWQFNSTGTSSIDVDGTSHFVLRNKSNDVDNSAPAHSDYVNFHSINNTGTAEDPYLLIDEMNCPDIPEEPVATSTPVSLPCDLENYTNNDLSMIIGCSEEWGSSTTSPEKTTYWYFHIPLFLWIIIAVPLLWIGNRLIIEWVIRLRK